jgi:hypothetical protein
MTTAMLEKRISVLEREIRTLRAVVLPRTSKAAPKFSRGLRVALIDAKAGRVSGPFRSATTLMKHLEK